MKGTRRCLPISLALLMVSQRSSAMTRINASRTYSGVASTGHLVLVVANTKWPVDATPEYVRLAFIRVIADDRWLTINSAKLIGRHLRVPFMAEKGNYHRLLGVSTVVPRQVLKHPI